jgi:hypothetical protein
MDKSMKRAERRWRSHCVWMRRLRVDWATHGWQYNLVPQYDWGGPDPKKILGWRSTLCACFELTNREATRFKDTPTGNESLAAYRKSDGYHLKEVWESRKLEVERPHFGKPKKYRLRDAGMRTFRVQCSACGFLIARARMKNDWRVFRSYMEKNHGNRYVVRCEVCKVRLRR